MSFKVFLLFKVIAREHLGTQGTLAREDVSTQDTLVCELVSTQDTLALKHARHVGT